MLNVFLSIRPIDRTYFLEVTVPQWAEYKMNAQDGASHITPAIKFSDTLKTRLAVMLAGQLEDAQKAAPQSTAKAVREKIGDVTDV